MTQQQKRKNLKRIFVLLAVVLFAMGVILARYRLYSPSNTIFSLLNAKSSEPLADGIDSGRPFIIGHRGSGLITKDGSLVIGNTTTAIERAIAANVDWIEIDIRRSRDNHLVVFHDAILDDKTDLSGEVANLDLDTLKSAQVLVDPPEQILTLDELFSQFHPRQKRWVFDIKDTGLSIQFLHWLQDQHSTDLNKDQVVLFGTYEVLSEYRNTDYKLGYTLVWKDRSNLLRVLFSPASIISRCKEIDCDYLVLPIFFASDSLVQLAKQNGIDVWMYGSDDAEDHKQAVQRGITGLIVDRPYEAMKQFVSRE